MGDKRGAYWVLMGRPEERDNLEDLGVDGRIILKCILKKCGEGMDCIYLVQDMDRWRALVIAVLNFTVQ